MINVQSNFGNSPQPEVLHSTEPLLSILIDRITGIPYEGYFKVYDVPELPTDADDFWRIKYGHIGGDDYLITAVRVWGDEIYTRRLNVYTKAWKTDTWSKIANQDDLAFKLDKCLPIPLGTDILTLGPGRYSIDGVTADIVASMNLPIAQWHYTVNVYAAHDKVGLEYNYKVIMVFAVDVPLPFINQMNWGGGWTGWYSLTTSRSPDEHWLTISDGLVGNSDMSNTYRKSNDGRVTVGLGVTAADSASSSSETYIADGSSVFILPAGFRTYQHEVRHIDFSNRGGSPNGYGHLHLYPSGLAEVRGVSVPDARSMFCEFGFWTKQEQATLQSQVHLAAEDPALMSLAEPIEKCMCVVDKDDRYMEFVLVTIEQDDTGVVQTIHNYTMADGERLVNASVPPIKYLRDNKLPRPSWDEATSTWLE